MVKNYCIDCADLVDDFELHLSCKSHLCRKNRNWFDSQPKFKLKLINVLCFANKRQILSPIPDIFKPMHDHLSRFLYPLMEFDLVKQRIECLGCTKIEFDNLEDFFMPNLAFLFLCFDNQNFLAKQLCDWELVDFDYIVWAFKLYFDRENIQLSKYYFNRFIIQQLNRDHDFLQIDLSRHHFPVFVLEDKLVSFVNDLIYLSVLNEDWDFIKFAYMVFPKLFLYKYYIEDYHYQTPSERKRYVKKNFMKRFLIFYIL